MVYTITSVVSVSGLPWSELLYSDYASEFYSRCRAIAFQHRGEKRRQGRKIAFAQTKPLLFAKHCSRDFASIRLFDLHSKSER